MKQLLLLITFSSMIFGCAEEKEPNRPEVVGEIVGQWKLIYVHQRSWDSYIADVSANNIVYNFRSNGILDVNAETVLLEKGQHDYSFEEETLIIDGQSFETQVVTIKNRRWLCSFSNGEMSISELDNDGGTLTFVRH
jgi:hypothetical protein